MRLPYFLSAVILLTSLSGCGWLKNSEHGPLRNRNHDYVRAKSLEPMQLPAGQDSKRLDPLYPVPAAATDSKAKLMLPPRPTPAPLLATEVFVLQETASQSWILAQREPAQVWPLAQAFFLSRGFGITEEHPQRGEFIVRHTSTSSLEQGQEQPLDYLIRIQPGLEPKTSELMLEYSENGQPFSDVDLHLVSSALSPLQQYMLNTSELGDSYSLLASYDQRGPQQRVQNLGGNLILRVQTDMEQAWPAVGRALQKSGMHVRAQNKARAVYVLDLQKETSGKKRGIFASLNNLLKDTYQRIEEEKRLEREAELIAAGKDVSPSEQSQPLHIGEGQHQLRLRSEGDNLIVLSLEDASNQPAESVLASSVLNRLREQLNREDFARVETASANAFAERQVLLQERDQSWQLRIRNKGLARAWQDLDRALQSEDFTRHDELSNEAVFVVSVREQQWRRDADSALSLGSLYQRIEAEKRAEREKQARKKQDDKEKEAAKYRLQLQSDDTDTLLLILHEDSSAANDDQAKQIIQRIQQLLD